MSSSVPLSKSVEKLKVLFVYSDNRAIYLAEELRKIFQRMDFLKIRINPRELSFLKNMFMCYFEILFAMFRKDSFSRINLYTLYLNTIRRPNYIRKMSSTVSSYVNTMDLKPDLILQWQGIFKPYVNTPNIPFALIIDNYTDPPDSINQKDAIRGWSTIYNENFYRMQKELYNNSTLIFTLSKWCKEGLNREYAINPEKIFAIGWGAAKKIEVDQKITKKEKTILAIGSNYKAKGLDVLLKAASYLSDFRIIIVGKDPSFRLGKVPKNVHITDHFSDQELIKLYSESELFFSFSEFEPSAHAIWEAQAYGCVIIGYDAFGISEAVIHNLSGILLKTRDPDKVSQEIRALYRKKGSLKQMQMAAIRNYKENGTWYKASTNLVMNLNQLLQAN